MRLEIVLTEQDSDRIGEGFELGIRIGELPASTLMARPIESIEYLLAAAPDYLERHGTLWGEHARDVGGLAGYCAQTRPASLNGGR